MCRSCNKGANVGIFLFKKVLMLTKNLIYLTFLRPQLLRFQRFGRTFAIPFLTEKSLC